MRLRRTNCVIALVAIVGGCSGAAPGSVGTPEQTSLPVVAGHRPGEPLDAGVRPAAGDCRDHLAADIGAAKQLRTELHIDGIPSTDLAILAAAADPRSEIATLGIPLTAGELDALRASGTFTDRSSPLRFWVQAAAPQRFGGIWIDPPGSDRYVVAILDKDPSALALARCLDTGLDVRYVAAKWSVAEDNALQARIGADFGELRSLGIEVQSVGVGLRSAVMVVIVGVTGLTDQIRASLVARYGDEIVVEEQGPITPS